MHTFNDSAKAWQNDFVSSCLVKVTFQFRFPDKPRIALHGADILITAAVNFLSVSNNKCVLL